MLSRKDGKPGKVEAGVEPLLRLAADLRDLPRADFKARLKSQLKSEFMEGRKIMSTVAEPVTTVHTVATPRLTFKDAAKAIEFYTQALGAKEVMRFDTGDEHPPRGDQDWRLVDHALRRVAGRRKIQRRNPGLFARPVVAFCPQRAMPSQSVPWPLA